MLRIDPDWSDGLAEVVVVGVMLRSGSDALLLELRVTEILGLSW